MTNRVPAIINLHKGSSVWFEGSEYVIQSLLDLETVLAKSVENGSSCKLLIKELKPTKEYVANLAPISLVDLPKEKWEIAKSRFNAIKPLLQSTKFRRPKTDVIACANNIGVSVATIYRWLDIYEQSGVITSLLRPKRIDKGRTKISTELETLISDVIQSEYLKEQRVTVSGVYEELCLQCRKKGLKPVHKNTLRNRVKNLPDAMKIKARHGRQIAKKFEPIRGEFPGGNWPLEYVQIDHTPLDIILVDDQHRMPVGRPFITLAIDVYSRMVTGFYLSYDPPSCMTVGLCIAHSVLPKDNVKPEFGVICDWPIQGKMKTIHVDNGLEFRSDVMKRACDQHEIDIEWRPVREPQYGGHVERMFRTINTKVHELPGTTFSSVKEREYYKSEKYSSMTLEEFEKWLTTFIVDKYHQSFHSKINMTPASRYEEGVLGDLTKGIVGVGLRPRVVDTEKFRIDFMPFVKRTIQNYGMKNESVYYYHDVLRRWIHEKDKKSNRKKLFVFHYDPRDMSKYYFWDPELLRYYKIPYRDNHHPPISLWELRSANRLAKEEGYKNVDEDILFDAYERMKNITQQSVAKTASVRKKRRREEQRKNDHVRQIGRQNNENGADEELEKDDEVDMLLSNIDIRPFDDISG